MGLKMLPEDQKLLADTHYLCIGLSDLLLMAAAKHAVQFEEHDLMAVPAEACALKPCQGDSLVLKRLQTERLQVRLAAAKLCWLFLM